MNLQLYVSTRKVDGLYDTKNTYHKLLLRHFLNGKEPPYTKEDIKIAEDIAVAHDVTVVVPSNFK